MKKELLLLAFAALGHEISAQGTAATTPNQQMNTRTSKNASTAKSYAELHERLHKKLTGDPTREVGNLYEGFTPVINKNLDTRQSIRDKSPISLVLKKLVPRTNEKVISLRQKLAIVAQDPNAPIPDITYVVEENIPGYTHKIPYNKNTRILFDKEPDFQKDSIVIHPGKKTIVLNRENKDPITFILNSDELPDITDKAGCQQLVANIFPQTKNAVLSRNGDQFTIKSGDFNSLQNKIALFKEQMNKTPEKGKDYVSGETANGKEIRFFVENPAIHEGDTRTVSFNYSKEINLFIIPPTDMDTDPSEFDGDPREHLTIHLGTPDQEGKSYTAQGNSLGLSQDKRTVIMPITGGNGKIHLDDVPMQNNIGLSLVMMREIGGINCEGNTALFLDKNGNNIGTELISREPLKKVVNKDGSVGLMVGSKPVNLIDPDGKKLKLEPGPKFRSGDPAVYAGRPSLSEAEGMYDKMLEIPGIMAQASVPAFKANADMTGKNGIYTKGAPLKVTPNKPFVISQ